MAKVNLQNAYNFIEGHVNNLLEEYKVISFNEQVQYRKLICSNDCIKQGKCIKCGCSSPKRLYSTKTCNPSRFPDIMSPEEWSQYKINNYEQDLYLQQLFPEGID